MQHVADPGMFDTVDPFGPPGAGVQPVHRRSSLLRDPADASVRSGPMPRVSVQHIGAKVRDGAEQPAVRELVALLLRRPPQGQVDAHLDGLLARGLPAEHVYLRVLQPAARHLGDLWREDACTFVDVTLATAALHGGMRHLAPHFHRFGRIAREVRTLILGTLGGDQHTFGLAMTAEFFRRSGWTVFRIVADSEAEIAAQARAERHAVVGYSVSRADQLPALTAAIRRWRRLGSSRVAGILVGGPLFVADPDSMRQTGADAIGLDARQAVAEAEALVAAVSCQ